MSLGLTLLLAFFQAFPGPGATSSVVTDNFANGAVANELETYSSRWTANTAGIEVFNNNVRLSSAVNDSTVVKTWNLISPFPANQYAQIEVEVLGNGTYFGPVVRSPSSGVGGYRCTVEVNLGAVYLERLDSAAASTTLGTSSAMVPAAGDVCRVKAVGNQVSVEYKLAAGSFSSLISAVTDATYASGRPGVSGYNGMGAAVVGTFKNWEAGTL